jgi:hypothetical protein
MRFIILAIALSLVACKSSKPATPPAPVQPTPAPAPASITMGGSAQPTGAEMLGTAGPLQGNEVVVTTTATALPPVGAQGTLFWVVDRPIPVFGQGVNLSLATVAVKQVQPGSVTLTVVKEAGPISLNGQRVNVFQPGIAVKLAY